MARVTLGGGISSLNGSIGGTTYQNSASGTIAKNKGIKTKSTSSQAQYSKQVTSVVSQAWSDLSAATRDAWDAYAIFKPVPQKHNSGRFLTGQQIFNLYNSAMYMYNGGIISSPIFITTPSLDTTITIHSDGSSLYLRSSTGYDESSYIGIYKLSAQVRGSQSRSVGGVKYMPVIFSGGGESDITNQYVALYGFAPVENEYIEMEYQIFNVANPNWTPKFKKVYVIQAY